MMSFLHSRNMIYGISIAFILWLLPMFAQTQPVKKISIQTANAYEEYEVLIANEKIRQGNYLKLTASKTDTLAAGTYDKNEKTGYWRFFELGTLIAYGEYKQGEKTGIWAYYENGTLTLQYDHANRTILFQKPNNHLCELKTGLCFAKSVLSTAAEYPGFYHLIYEQLAYPENAVRMGVEGKVIVSCVVDTEGYASQFKIEKDIGSGCGDALLNVLKSFEKGWLPATLHESVVPVRVLIEAEFKLRDNGDKAIIVRKL
jgi:hypothetical protein